MLPTFRLKPLQALYIAQFLSAFVDNMILFIALAILKRDAYPAYYLPFVQSTFLAAYIFLSPWVGRFADKRPKSEVLIIGNIIKAFGILLLFLGVNPALSYATVGVGAVTYSPAKYGILPLLTADDEQLLKANSSLESYTILAILTGSIAGGFLAEHSITMAIYTCLFLYGASIVVNTMIPKDPGNPTIGYKNAVFALFSDITELLRNKQSHYSLIGTGSFWMASAVLRMILFAWAPIALSLTKETEISMIIAVTGVGITIGALITPKLISMKTYGKTVWFGFALGLSILAFILVHDLIPAIVLLLLVGIFGGIYIVPMNACLQQVGHQSIGTGKTIAIQNFVENLFMFLGVGAYTLAAKSTVHINTSLGASGLALLLLVTYLFIFNRRRNLASAQAASVKL